MKNAFASKMSYFILTFVFLIIVASFLFSGFDKASMGGVGGSKNVASVDGTPISTKEYQMALNRQVEFYNQMMGGSGMTQKQLEELGIKQSVLNGLIQQKLILNAAGEMGFVVSTEESKNEIKNLQFFKKGNQFDVNTYRNVLQANGYTPSQFEDMIGNDLKQRKVDELFNSTMVSENFVKDVLKFKNNLVVVNGIKVNRQSLAPLVSVSAQEIKEYISNPENKKNLESVYSENYAKYNQPEELKARHILIQGQDAKAEEKIKAIKAKINVRNFADIAKKETEDPTGKPNGGELGWFAKGRMVPEFDNVAFKLNKGEISEPVKTQFGWHIILLEDKKSAQTKTLESVQNELAQMAIQKTKAQDLDKLLKQEQDRLTEALNKNDAASLEAAEKKIGAQIFKNTEVNQYDQNLGQMTLAPKEADQVFKAAPGEVLNFGNPGTIYLVKIVSKRQGDDLQKKITDQLKNEVTSQNQAFSRKIREDLLKNMTNKAKVVTNPGLL